MARFEHRFEPPPHVPKRARAHVLQELHELGQDDMAEEAGRQLNDAARRRCGLSARELPALRSYRDGVLR